MENIRYLRFAKEATFGVAKVDSDFDVDIASSSLDAPTDAMMVVETGLGRGASSYRGAYYSPTGNAVFYADYNTLKSLMGSVLGKILDETVAFGMTHAYGGNNRVLDSYTIYVGKDSFEHVFTGCVINQFQLEVSDQFAQVTLDLVCANDEIGGAVKSISSLKLTTSYPMAFTDFVGNINGVDSFHFRKMSLSVTNNVSSDSGKRLGKRNPQQLLAAERETTLSVDMDFVDTSMLTKYHNSQAISIGFQATDPDGKLMDINIPRCMMTENKHEVANAKDEIVEVLAVRALYAAQVLEGSSTTVNTDIAFTFK